MSEVKNNQEPANNDNEVLAAVYDSIEAAVIDLNLSKRVEWKNYLGYLARWTKKSICPEFVTKNGIPVQLNCR